MVYDEAGRDDVNCQLTDAARQQCTVVLSLQTFLNKDSHSELYPLWGFQPMGIESVSIV